MADQPPGPSGDDDPFAIDTDTATPARVLNYLAGGDVNFAADRELAEELGDALPGGIDTARAAVQTLSAFMSRAVRYLAGEAGIAQFVNVGAGVITCNFIRSISVVPPATNTALGARTRCKASCVSSALAYVNGIMASPVKFGAAVTSRRQQCWDTPRSGRCSRSCIREYRRRDLLRSSSG